MTQRSGTDCDALIIGAGPAGLMAGIRASSRGRNTIIIDKNPVPGRKLLISGKGRCNVTNAEQDVTELLKNFSKTGQFLRNALYLFSNKDLMDFFAAQSVELIVERGKRVFPGSAGRRTSLMPDRGVQKNGGRIMLNRDIRK
jgi:predicted flavoprotein YhiN